MRKEIKILLITMVIVILMGCYKPLIGVFISDKYLAAFLQKLLKAATVVIYITTLRLWNEIKLIKKASRESLLILLPVAILALVPILNGIKISNFKTILIVLATTILIGIVEELLFRGIIFSVFEESGTIGAIIVSSIAFAIVHLLNLVYGADLLETIVQVVFAFGFGLVMATARSKSNSMLPLIMVHALWDFVYDISNTNFTGIIDGVHTAALVIVVLWGMFLVTRTISMRKNIL